MSVLSALAAYGATPQLVASVPADRVLGRVTLQARSLWRVVTESGELATRPRARMSDPPVAGDWVTLVESGGTPMIDEVLPRRTVLVRKVAGLVTQAQVVAANVDTVLLVQSLDADFNARRLERYLALVWEGGGEPVIVLTKADQADETFVAEALDQCAAVGLGVAVHVVSARSGAGIEELRTRFVPGRTLAVLGSSGVGKSTLVNLLAGAEVMATAEVRADGRGRHTTTHRELIMIPGGGLILDTPGMRELQLWSAEEGLATVFSDIEAAAESCRFNNCSHEGEPGCAVRAALDDGTLLPERFESWTKLQREQGFLARRQDARLAADDKRKWKHIAKAQKGRNRP